MTDEQRAAAIGRIKAKREFWTHVITYVIVNTMLVVIWALSTGTGSYFWPIWSIAGWGIGLIFHAWNVFRGERPIGEDEIQREIERGL